KMTTIVSSLSARGQGCPVVLTTGQDVRHPSFVSLAAATAIFAGSLLMPQSAVAQGDPGARAADRVATLPAPAVPGELRPYVPPQSTYVPPRTRDGQPDISGLYVPIALPGRIETARVPLPPGKRNPVNAGPPGYERESSAANPRPRAPEGAAART